MGRVSHQIPRALGLSAAVLIASVAAACAEPAEPPPAIGFLASDAYFKVGDDTVVLPFVAVGDAIRTPGDSVFADLNNSDKQAYADQARRNAVRLAGDPRRPLHLASVEVSIQTYRYWGQHASSVGICTRLTRQWSRHLCRDDRAGILRDLPTRFRLQDRAYVQDHDRTHPSEQLAGLNPARGATDMRCEANSRFCTAAVGISKDVIAVWTVWPEANEAAAGMAHRQGAAIYAFTRFAAGETENPVGLAL